LFFFSNLFLVTSPIFTKKYNLIALINLGNKFSQGIFYILFFGENN